MDWQTLFNNGVAVGVLLYFMWFTQTSMKEFTKALTENTEAIIALKSYMKGAGVVEKGD